MIEQKQEWSNSTKYLLVTEHSSLTIYFCNIEAEDPKKEMQTWIQAWIGALWVDKDYRNQGLATKLLDRADEIIQNAGYDRVFIMIDNESDTYEICKKMFRKRGFVTIDDEGTMVNRYIYE